MDEHFANLIGGGGILTVVGVVALFEEAGASGSAKFLFQVPDDIGDEIVEAPADVGGELLHAGQPVSKLRIQFVLLAEECRQFV